MDFLYKRHPKGTYAHADYKKKVDTLVMLFLFALALGLYITGRVATGSNRNILTIVAVLGLLPACKMVVDVIMSLRVKPCDTAIRDKVDEAMKQLPEGTTGLYNMYFTSYDRNYLLAHLTVAGATLIGLSCACDFDEKAYKEHMSDLIRKEGIGDVLIKVFTDTDKYTDRLTEIGSLGDKAVSSAALVTLIKNVTL